MKDDSFDKILKKEFTDKKRIKKIYDTIKDLEVAENEYMISNEKDRKKLNQFGKTLSKIGHKDTYCLEIGTDRFLAHVVEDEKAKIFIWYWGGSHEKYNNVLKNLPAPKNDSNFKNKVNGKISELEIEEDKQNACKKIKALRENCNPSIKNKKNYSYE